MNRGLSSGGGTTAQVTPPSLEANIVMPTYSAHMFWEASGSIATSPPSPPVTTGHSAPPVNFAVPLSCVPQSIVPSAAMSP